MNTLKNKTFSAGALCFLVILQFFVSCPGSSASDIALYSDKGADEDCVKATKNMFEWMGYSVKLIKVDDVNKNSLSGYEMICFPGGNMYDYGQTISDKGKANIVQFVQDGGAYIGICAGAYFAAEKVIWQGTEIPTEPLKIFAGTSIGPLDNIVPYPAYGMCKVNIVDHNHPITQSESDSIWVLYYWGPALTPDTDATVAVLGRYDITKQPAMISFEYYSGRVFLMGTHPEFEEDSDRDGTNFADSLDDRGSDWNIMKKAVNWCINK